MATLVVLTFNLSSMKKFFCSIFLLIFLSNCVFTKNISLSSDEFNNVHGKTIAVVSREKSDMTLKTPFHAAFIGGLLVSFSMVYQGNKIVKENDIDDPSFLVAKKLQSDLAKSHNLKIANSLVSEKVDTYNVSKISDLYRGIADYVVDVRTLNWGLSYVSADISNYAIIYSSQMKLIDVKNSKVIAENACTFTPYKKYQKDVMLADKAIILKQEFIGAADACAKLFKEIAFNLK